MMCFVCMARVCLEIHAVCCFHLHWVKSFEDLFVIIVLQSTKA